MKLFSAAQKPYQRIATQALERCRREEVAVADLYQQVAEELEEPAARSLWEMARGLETPNPRTVQMSALRSLVGGVQAGSGFMAGLALDLLTQAEPTRGSLEEIFRVLDTQPDAPPGLAGFEDLHTPSKRAYAEQTLKALKGNPLSRWWGTQVDLNKLGRRAFEQSGQSPEMATAVFEVLAAGEKPEDVKLAYMALGAFQGSRFPETLPKLFEIASERYGKKPPDLPQREWLGQALGQMVDAGTYAHHLGRQDQIPIALCALQGLAEATQNPREKASLLVMAGFLNSGAATSTRYQVAHSWIRAWSGDRALQPEAVVDEFLAHHPRDREEMLSGALAMLRESPARISAPEVEKLLVRLILPLEGSGAEAERDVRRLLDTLQKEYDSGIEVGSDSLTVGGVVLDIQE